MPEVCLDAYRENSLHYKDVQFADYNGEQIAYREVWRFVSGKKYRFWFGGVVSFILKLSGLKSVRKYHFWLICGRPIDNSIHGKRGGKIWFCVSPIPTPEEQNGIRTEFGKFLPAPFVFLESD